MRFIGWIIVAVLFAVPFSMPPAQAQGGFPREVVDTSGQIVHVPVRPQTVAMIGTNPVLPLLVPDVRRIEIVPEAWEAIDLLVVPEVAVSPVLMEAAEASGVPIFRAAPVMTLDGWRLLAERLGVALGREDEADRLVKRLNDRLAWLNERLRDDPVARVLVLTPEGYTFGEGTLITELIAAAGGINVAADAGFADYRQITDSAIRDLAPDVILLSPAWSPSQIATFQTALDIPARVIVLPFSPTMPNDPAAALLALGFVLHLR